MTTLFEIQKSSKGIKYNDNLTEKELEKAFGVTGYYSFTTSSIDGSSFVFYGRSVEGNTYTTVTRTGDVKITTVLRSAKPYDNGLIPEETEIGDIVFLIQKKATGFVFKGVVDLISVEITDRKKEDRYNWLLSCIYHGKIRDENNAYSLSTVEKDTLETAVYIPSPEGKKKAVYTTTYERNPANRAAAIAEHGTVCMACGFDFGKMYGRYGEGFIEVHHTKPLFEGDGEIVPDPKTDLICLCANCHRMVHHFKNKVLTLQELKEIIREAERN